MLWKYCVTDWVTNQFKQAASAGPYSWTAKYQSALFYSPEDCILLAAAFSSKVTQHQLQVYRKENKVDLEFVGDKTKILVYVYLPNLMDLN